MKNWCLFIAMMGLIWCHRVTAQSPAIANIHAIPSDLLVPKVIEGAPAPGKRVWQTLPGYEGWDHLAHTVYLPAEWKPAKRYPVIVEYPGNGNFKNNLGDISTGRVEDCKLGYGLSAGRGFIWICLPFVDVKARKHTTQWWGDPDATAAYCRRTVGVVCRDLGGDLNNVILTGFSRGAIACGYIGLRDEATAKLWRAMVPHSHYDGVRRWGYPEDDVESARKRLARLGGKPQFITHELSVDATRQYLNDAHATGATLVPLPFPNHTDEWVLKDCAERRQLRAWLADVVKVAP
jgi:hypothetical protein